MALLTCYNRGCGIQFSPEDNKEESCHHHPGGPVFHDAYKGWSCCKKRSIDFTEFLSIPGCAKGLHNPVKPAPLEKKVEKPLNVGEVITDNAQQMKFQVPDAPVVRPSNDIPRIKIKETVAGSLQMALKKFKEKQENEKINSAGIDGDVVQLGAACKHNTCDCKYLGEDSSTECTYHPGYPVFHEGYKFWTCCSKRTSDFNEFLKQGGCEVGKHDWMKPSEVAEKKSTCRYDWHQTGTNVLISIYAKICDPGKCIVEANPTNINAVIAFNGGTNIFELDLKLHGIIDPELSKVEYMGTKAEIKLRKVEAFSWPRLEYKEES